MIKIKKVLASLYTREKYAGFVDTIFLYGKRLEISGWACDMNHKDRQLQVDVFLGPHQLASTACCTFRIDLKELGYGNGFNGFHAIMDIGDLEPGLNHKVAVRISGSNFYLQDKNASTSLDKLLFDEQASPFHVSVFSADKELVIAGIKCSKDHSPTESIRLVTRTGTTIGTGRVIGDEFSIIPSLTGDENNIFDLYLLDGSGKPLLSRPIFLENESEGEGLVTEIEPTHIAGWAYILSTRYLPATVLAYVHDELIGYAVANKFREDVFSPFSNLGFCGFRIDTNRVLTADDIRYLQLKIAGTGSHVEVPGYMRIPAPDSAVGSDKNTQAEPKLVGYLDQCSTQFIPGWAVNMTNPEIPANVDIFINDRHITTLTPDVYRKDVNEKYSLKGDVGFNFELPAGLSLSGEVYVDAKFHGSEEVLYNCPRKIIFGLHGASLFSPPPQAPGPDPVWNPQVDLDFPEPSLAIIVLNRNGGNHLRKLFSSFDNFNSCKNYRIYIVDHSSRDDSEAVCEEWQTKLNISFIQRGSNYSFSASNNFIAGSVTEEILLFLNNDITFTSDILSQAVSFFQDPEAGIVGIKLLSELSDKTDDNPVQHLGVRFDFSRPNRTFLPYEIMDLNKDSPLFATVHTPPAVTAAFMLIRREDFRKINGFDEGYFYGFEDVDFCLTFASRVNKKIICATELGVLHKTSSTRQRLAGKEKKRVAANFKRLNERIGKHLVRSYRHDRSNGVSNLTGKRFTLAFAVSGTSLDIPEGDFYTAYELGAELCEQFGWEIRFLAPADWYRLKGFDAVVAMRHDFNPRLITEQSPYVIKIAWLRNWFEGWMAADYIRDYDLIWCASAKATDILKERTGALVKTLYIATNHKSFSPGPESLPYKSDYSFTGSFHRSPRQIFFDLEPDNLPFDFSLYGSNWENIPKFNKYVRGHIPYTEMPCVYRSTKLVLDDVNHTVKGWGSVNSRVFDALAAGALVLTNDICASVELFDGLLPYYSDRRDLTEKLCAFMADDTSRRNLAATLRRKVLENHTYELRARQVYSHILEYDTRVIRIGIVTNPEMIHAGIIARQLHEILCAQGHVVHRRTIGQSDRNQSLGDDAIIFISDHHSTTTLPYPPEGHQYNILLFGGSLDQLPFEALHKLDEIVVLNAGDHIPELADRAISIHCLEECSPRNSRWRISDTNLSASDASLLLETSLFSKQLIPFCERHFASLRERLETAATLKKSADETSLNFISRNIASTDEVLVSLKYFPGNLRRSEYRASLYRNLPYNFDISPSTIDAAVNNLKQSDRKTVFHLDGIAGIIGRDNTCNEILMHRTESFLLKLDEFIDLKGIFIWTIHGCPRNDEPQSSLINNLFQALLDRVHVASVFTVDARETLMSRFNVTRDALVYETDTLPAGDSGQSGGSASSMLIDRINRLCSIS